MVKLNKPNRIKKQRSDKSIWWCGCDRTLTSDINICENCGQKRNNLNKKLKNANFDEKTELDLDN